MKDFPEEGGNVKASTARKNKKTNHEAWVYKMLIYKSIFATSEILNVSQVA